MAYEWDDNKSEQTRRTRGFGFEIMEDFDWNFAALFDVQTVDFEERELWIGPIGDTLYAVVITMRGGVTRIISLRYATPYEINIWRDQVQ